MTDLNGTQQTRNQIPNMFGLSSSSKRASKNTRPGTLSEPGTAAGGSGIDAHLEKQRRQNDKVLGSSGPDGGQDSFG